MPGEWGQCVPIVEWIRYNTPSRCGLTPRDIDKGWSIVSPLERELLPSGASWVGDSVRSGSGRSLRPSGKCERSCSSTSSVKGKGVPNWLTGCGPPEAPWLGDLVMLRDPARTKTKIGHRPGKIPAEGPYEVVSAHGSSAKVAHTVTKESQRRRACRELDLPAVRRGGLRAQEGRAQRR